MWQYDYKKAEAEAAAKPRFSRMSDIDMMAQGKQVYGEQSVTIKKRKRIFDGDDALEDDSDDDQQQDQGADQYQPAPGSPGPETGNNDDDDDEEDPLDAFMVGVEAEAKKDKEKSLRHAKPSTSKDVKVMEEEEKRVKKKGLGRTDVDGEEDMQESYFKFLEENKDRFGDNDDEDDDDEIEYDIEGNAIRKRKVIDPLPALDHNTVNYQPFNRIFYVEHENIATLSRSQTDDLRRKLGITVNGMNAPKPVSSFGHFGFDRQLMEVIRKQEFTQPTPIQAQGIPIALSGRDVIGIAKTGSGKTAAYLWPALVHIMDQRELVNDEGPIALICVPTRELAIQVYNEARKFGKVYNINVVCAYGGGSKYEQSKDLAEGAEIVVCTPGRMIDMVKIQATNLERVTYLVFDEADKMFNLGFEPQVRSIANHVRPDRQCLMFSATFKKKVERLARDILTDPIRIVQGQLGEANEDIAQHVEVLPAATAKWAWIQRNLVNFCANGKVLIFVNKKANCVQLADSLKGIDFKVVLLHGDLLQYERNEVLSTFKKDPNIAVLIATDVAARGLDIPTIKTVVNYDVARDIDTHVHRIGRTGRAGEKGTAYTLTSEEDKEFAGHLVRNLESVGQTVSGSLMSLAMKSSWFRSSRSKAGQGEPVKAIGFRGGLGFKERPGLGSKTSSSATGSNSGGSTSSNPFLTLAPKSIPFSVKPMGGQTNRVASLKSAYKNSLKSSFQAAADNSDWKSNSYVMPPPPPSGTSSSVDANSSTSAVSSGERKKKSRWS